MTRQTVMDAEGTRYILEKRSAESSRVRNPDTGEQLHLPNDELEPLDGESPLVTAARAVPEEVRTLLTATHSERALGLVIELQQDGPLPVRALIEQYDLCESDLHGILGELQAAGIISETTVFGERGYELTSEGVTAITQLTG